MRLIKHCSICNKPLDLKSAIRFEDGSKLKSYKCGHTFHEPKDDIIELIDLDFTSADGSGKEAREYQKLGIQFIINSGFSAILADQMRLGKTPQANLALKNRLAERTPCLYLVRSANLWQHVAEIKTWISAEDNAVWPIINGTKGFIPKGFKVYVISMDTFSRAGMVDKLLKFGFRLVIADEAHSFKNQDSNRSQALVQFLHDVAEEELITDLKLNCIYCKHEWSETVRSQIKYVNGVLQNARFMHTTQCPNCKAGIGTSAAKINSTKKERKCGVILLTGTPIKNRADEYFVPLNLVAPEYFPSYERFKREWLEQDGQGKWSHIKGYKREQFKDLIAPYVLRREKEDVYKDLPQLNRIFTVIDHKNDELSKMYNEILDRLELKLASRVHPTWLETQTELMALRRICGLMKVMWVGEYLKEAVEDTEDARFAVGLHHIDVKDLLLAKLGTGQAMSLSGSDNADNKYRIMKNFEHSNERILLLNMLAGGVGMDFHYVDNVLVMERQWNAADEEQFEFRFYNPDKSIKDRSTNVEYIIIKDTIEEFFYSMVERKRQVFGETIGTNWKLTEDHKSYADLIGQTVGSRLK